MPNSSDGTTYESTRMLVSVVEFVLRENDDQQREEDGVLSDLREELRQPETEKAAVRKDGPLPLLKRRRSRLASRIETPVATRDGACPHRRPTHQQGHDDCGAHQHRPHANELGEGACHQ